MRGMGLLARGRRLADARWSEVFEAYTLGERVLGADGLYTYETVVLYSGVPGRLRYSTFTVYERAQAAQDTSTQDVEIHVPVGATPGVVVGVLWRVTASTADPTLVGRVFRTKGEAQSGQVTAHRYPVERVT